MSEGRVPELSVVIPAFDAGKTLDSQLDALAAQHVDFAVEVLVCDNGSKDATVGIVRRRQESEPWLRLVDASARRGPAAARNIGAAVARGEMLAFCDADDVVGVGWLAGMHRALGRDEFVSGSWECDLLDGRGASVSWTNDSVYTLPYMPWLVGTGAGTMGIRRRLFEQVGGFDERLRTNEDTDLAWRVQLAGHRLVHHPEIVLHVRKRSGLLAVFRQAYAYGVGDELLRHRYADVVAAFERRVEGSVEPSASGPGSRSVATSRWRAVASRASRLWTRVRRRQSLLVADKVHNVGHALGERRERRRPTPVDPVPVPSGLAGDR